MIICIEREEGGEIKQRKKEERKKERKKERKREKDYFISSILHVCLLQTKYLSKLNEFSLFGNLIKHGFHGMCCCGVYRCT